MRLSGVRKSARSGTPDEYYEGTFRNGVLHGKGKATYSDGAVYEGDWVKGVREGKRTYIITARRMVSGEVLK